MAAQITQGPWRISGFEPSSGGAGRVVMGADGFGIAWLNGRSEAEHQADATAITAVPDMIEALEEVREHCSERADAEIQTGDDSYTGNAEMRLLMTVEAALRKAGVL